ncbi:hypothetical protein V5O48_007971 [Marasmius crinis-equi]|uniref:Uncharacterized protein n=1 Tax=Marasmius crinis-equi TaxID=585013 RepID=A0ABR3FF54_9AGAR
MSKKTESTTSLISKDSEFSKDFTSSSKGSPYATSPKSSHSSSNPTKVPTSMPDFAKKAKQNGWAAPTPTRPNLGF